MGRAGGFVRLSLVPLDQLTWGREDDGDDYYDDVPVEDGSGTEEDVELFRTHVLKTACFGGGTEHALLPSGRFWDSHRAQGHVVTV